MSQNIFSKFKKYVKQILYKHITETLVEEFQDPVCAEVVYRVVDRKLPILRSLDTRRLEFTSGTKYAYSTIYLDKHRADQPIYLIVQDLTNSFFRRKSRMRSALVLGCAGCSIPRFLVMTYKRVQVTGVEYSEKMIEIAQKYFLNKPMEKRFTLLHDDAFAFVHKTTDQYDFIHVDVFVAEKNHPQTFTDDFMKALSNIMSENSIAILNCLNLTKNDCNNFALRFWDEFTAAYVVDERFHYYVVFVKASDPATLKGFETRVAKYARIDERYVH